jgi:hypothetical protein
MFGREGGDLDVCHIHPAARGSGLTLWRAILRAGQSFSDLLTLSHGSRHFRQSFQ